MREWSIDWKSINMTITFSCQNHLGNWPVIINIVKFYVEWYQYKSISEAVCESKMDPCTIKPHEIDSSRITMFKSAATSNGMIRWWDMATYLLKFHLCNFFIMLGKKQKFLDNFFFLCKKATSDRTRTDIFVVTTIFWFV